MARRKQETKHSTDESGRKSYITVFVSVIGALAIIIGAVISYLGTIKGVSLPIEATQTAEAKLEILSETTPAILPTTASPIATKQLNPYTLLKEASLWPITENETFEGAAPGWSGFGTYSDEEVQHNMRIENGRLLWGIKPLVGYKWYWQIVPYHSYTDFFLSLKIKRDLGVVNNTQRGLIFRKSGDNGYFFQIDDKQYFSVYLYENDEWIPLIDWTKSNLIQPGELNDLTVIADGPTMTFFINRQYVGSTSDTTVSKGEIAIMAELDDPSPEITFEFDDFELRVKP